METTLTPPVPWYGGKVFLAPLIVSLMPSHTTYVEPFGGAGGVLFAKAPSPVEVYADVHGGVVALYTVLRDPALFGEFHRLCELTLYSREVHDQCRYGWRMEQDMVRKAWAFFVTVRQSFAGNGARLTASWGYCIGLSRRAMAATVSKWLSAIDGLPEIHARLRTVQIESGPWQETLRRYDTAETLFYIDPPYVRETRTADGYEHEMDIEQHHELTAALQRLQGMVILSGYRHDAVHAPLEACGWERRDIETVAWSKNARVHEDGRPARTESLWSNPAAVAARSQPSLFSSEEVRNG